ncbi:MAG: antitoxin [Acidimicrobiales bacterium]
MGFLDKIKGNSDKITDGLDKAGDMAKDKLGDKLGGHADKVDMAVDKAKDAVDGLDDDAVEEAAE